MIATCQPLNKLFLFLFHSRIFFCCRCTGADNCSVTGQDGGSYRWNNCSVSTGKKSGNKSPIRSPNNYKRNSKTVAVNSANAITFTKIV